MASKNIACRLPPLPSIGDLLRIYNLKATKKLSQNFLLDNKLQSKLVKMAGRLKNCHVVEVGPGPGTLTRHFYQQGASFVDVIEKDKRFIPTLDILKDAAHNNLKIHIGDILKFNMKSLVPEEFSLPWEESIPKVRLVGNLPFNVSTPLIIKWLQDISLKQDIWSLGRVPLTLTFQEEVAQRMVSPPNHSERGRLSIMCQNWCTVHLKFTIPGKAFVPKPKVNVSVVQMIPRKKPIIDLDFKLVEKVVYSAFSMRRKFCQRGLERLFPEHLRDELRPKLLTVADVNYEKRPYDLTMDDFGRLCHCYASLLKEHPILSKLENTVYRN